MTIVLSLSEFFAFLLAICSFGADPPWSAWQIALIWVIFVALSIINVRRLYQMMAIDSTGQTIPAAHPDRQLSHAPDKLPAQKETSDGWFSPVQPLPVSMPADDPRVIPLSASSIKLIQIFVVAGFVWRLANLPWWGWLLVSVWFVYAGWTFVQHVKTVKVKAVKVPTA